MLASLFLVGAFVSQVTADLAENRTDLGISSLADIGDTPVGVVAGSSFEAYLLAEELEPVGFDDQGQLLAAADRAEVDAVVTNPFAIATLGESVGIRAAGEVFYEEFETFGLAQGSPWREPINQALADLQSSGRVQRIVDRWVD